MMASGKIDDGCGIESMGEERKKVAKEKKGKRNRLS